MILVQSGQLLFVAYSFLLYYEATKNIVPDWDKNMSS